LASSTRTSSLEYTYEQSVADGVNVGYDVYEIETEVTKKGAELKAKEWVDHRERDTRKKRWAQTEDDTLYAGKELDRSVVNVSQIRQVIQAMKTAVETKIFPTRKETPKTLIFAKTDSHADDIINIVREVYGQGNAFCKKVTYRAEEDTGVTETAIPSEYVYFWLWSRYEQTRRGSSGNNQPALNKSIVEGIPLPLPPLEECVLIFERVADSIAKIESQEQEVANAAADRCAA